MTPEQIREQWNQVGLEHLPVECVVYSEIIAPAFEEPNWAQLRALEPERATEAIRSILTQGELVLEECENRLTVVRQKIFNVRMCCFRIVSDRELWKVDIDPEYGIPYKSMNRWIQVLYPKEEGMRYAQTANSVQKTLRAATIDDLAEIKQCNATTLAGKFVSDGCRSDREVIEAAKTDTENEFVERLNAKHNQHIEKTETLKLTYPSGDMAEYKRYLTRKAGLLALEPDDYSGTALALAIDDNVEFDSDEARETGRTQ